MGVSGRIPVPGVSHGDKVKLTGKDWPNFFPGGEVFEVDDESHHRPVIYHDSFGNGPIPWYIMNEWDTDFSVTKVES